MELAARKERLGIPHFAFAIVLFSFWISFPEFARAVSQQKAFKTPEEAAQALAQAAGKQDIEALKKIFGDAFIEQARSGDAAAEKNNLQKLSLEMKQKVNIVPGQDGKQIIEVGKANWPFPAPLVKQDGKWRFDSAAGAQEIIHRRVGENELRTIDAARFYVEAQNLYYSKPRDGSNERQYARAFSSSPGKMDGLYWPRSDGRGVSPLDPLVVRASAEGYTPGKMGGVYQGYHFKILTRQGPAAPGGAKDYMTPEGQMKGGFALLAYPVRWGVSGVMSFVVSNHGVVYEKNLGEKTKQIAEGISEFNPDNTWKVVDDAK